jgi:replicative DNA helicase
MMRKNTAGQAEIMIAKHRNGSIENVRLKFIGHLGKFDNLEDHTGGYDDLPSSMNQDDNPFVTKSSFSTRGIWKQFERR